MVKQAGVHARKRPGKSKGAAVSQLPQTGFSFTVTTTAPQGDGEAGGDEKLDFDWSLLREWAGANLDSTSQARMLFESEKKDRMGVDEAVSKFIMIKRLLEDELKRRGMR